MDASFGRGVALPSGEGTLALATYRAELDHQAALTTAQSEARRAFGLAQDQYNAGLTSSLDLLTSEETLVDADAAVASSDALVVQDQIAVFKALGGGWQLPNATAPSEPLKADPEK